MTNPKETAVAEAVKVELRPDTSKYVTAKSATGKKTMHTGDAVATGLASLTLDETFAVASAMLVIPVVDLAKKYGHLNLGMQRMNLGNRIRGAIAKADKGNVGEIAKVTRANTLLVARNVKLEEKSVKTHATLVAKIETANAVKDAEQQDIPERELVKFEVEADIPVLIEGAGEQLFLTQVAVFAPAIEKRAVEVELAIKEKADAKAKAEADKVAKAEAKAEAKKVADEAKADAAAKTDPSDEKAEA